jgi:hypothetical protein
MLLGYEPMGSCWALTFGELGSRCYCALRGLGAAFPETHCPPSPTQEKLLGNMA